MPGERVQFTKGKGYYAAPIDYTAAAAPQVNAIVRPQLDAATQARDAALQQTQQRADFITNLYKALAAIQQPGADQAAANYQAAGDRQATYAKGFSVGQQLATQKAAEQAQGLVAQQGLPGGQVQDQSQAGADVLYGLGGYNPASVFNAGSAALKTVAGQKTGDTQAAGALLSTAGLLSGGQQAESDYAKQLGQIEAQRAQLLPSLAKDLQNADYQRANYALGVAKANQAAAAAAAKAGAAANTINPTLSAAFGYAVNAQGEIVPDKNGKPIPYTPYVKPTVAGPTKLQVKTVNGHTVTFDPSTGTFYLPGTQEAVDPNSLTKPAKPPSAKQLSGARTYVGQAQQGYYAALNDSATPLSTSQLSAIAKSGSMTLGQLLQVTDPGTLQSLGIGYVKVGPHDDAKIQNLYVTLAKKYGLPARQAFNIVANVYKNWGAAKRAAYFPKDSAAQGAAFNSSSASQKAIAVTNLAREALGTPYVWGGAKPGGFDCSGLLYYVWGRVGVQIPRTTYDQWSAGKPVSRGALQPGDAVFFKGSDSIVRGGRTLPGHVGMYLGGGKVIEAPYTGANVEVTSLAGHRDYMGARRFV